MAKGGKLTKLLKKMQSFGRQSQNGRSTAAVSSTISSPSSDLHTVYVGKSRRQYLISSKVIHHPLFRELADRSSERSDDIDGEIVVGCEVVLFEHLLWMLDNAEPQPESLHELVEFYAY
ncbi:hypothetical protein Droror1_Dr00006848 [Drosera rotundifolia]